MLYKVGHLSIIETKLNLTPAYLSARLQHGHRLQLKVTLVVCNIHADTSYVREMIAVYRRGNPRNPLSVRYNI